MHHGPTRSHPAVSELFGLIQALVLIQPGSLDLHLTNTQAAKQSPIEQLSDDLLREIFVRCLPIQRWKITLSPSEAPVLLSHVCAHWRDMACGYALLWSRLHINAQLVHVIRGIPLDTPALKLFQNAAFRARAAPLHIRLTMRYPRRFFRSSEGRSNGTKTPTPQSNILARIIVPIGAQVAHLTRFSLQKVLFEDVCNLPSGLFPCMERLTLHCNFDPSVTRLSPARAFEDAPSLRRVAIGGCHATSKLDYSLSHLLLHLHQLTHFLDSGGQAYGDLFFPNFLQQCSSLEYLAIQLGGLYGDDRSESTVRLVTESTLKFLNISFWGGAMENDANFAYPEFLDFTEFPQLEALMLVGAELDFSDDRSWSVSQRDKFLTKVASFSHLQYLSISCTGAGIDHLATLFRATPHVTRLSLNITFFATNLLEVLNWDRAEYGNILPGLTTLVLGMGDAVVDCDWAVFVTNVFQPRVTQCILEDRSERRRLQKIIIYGKNQQHSKVVPFIEGLRVCASSGTLDYEERLTEDGRRCHYWLDPDPQMQDWPEIFVD